MNLLGAIGGALGSAVEEVLIAFRAETSDVEAKLERLDAKLAKAEQNQKAAFDAAQAQNQKAIDAERELASVDQQITTIRQELAQKRVASSAQEFEAIMRTRDALRADLSALTEYRSSVVAAVEQEAKLAMALQTTSVEMARKTAAAREAAVAGGGGALGGVVGVAVGLVGFQAVMALDQAIKSSITSWIEYGHAVEHASLLMGTSTENASRLLYVFQYFGLSVADADRTIAQLTRHIADNGAQFEALGIKTRQASGELVDSYSVFNQLREVMSQGGDGATKLALQLQLASRGGSAAGSTMAELNTILGLSNDEWAALVDQAQQAGVVMDSKTARSAYDLFMQMKALEAQQRAAGLALSQSLSPALEWATRAMMVGIEVARGYGAALFDLIKIVASASPLGLLHTLLTGEGSVRDQLAQFGQDFANAPTWDQINAAVDRQMENAKKAISVDDQLRNNSGGLKSNLADQRRAETQAIQDQIQAIEDLSRKREEEMRTTLTAYERKQQKAIETIQFEQKARDDAHRAEIERIQNASRQADDAFKDSQEARAKQIADLRTEVQLREQALQMFEQQWNLERDKKKLASDQGQPVGITAGESLIDYYKRVADQEQRVRDDQHRVTLDQRRLQLDQFKANTDAQIRAIEDIGRKEAEVNEQRKRVAEQRVRDIQDQQRAETERSQRAIKGIQDEMTLERDKTAAAIKNLQDVTRATVEELQKRLRDVSNTISGMGPVWAPPWAKWGPPPTFSSGGGGGPRRSPDATDRDNGVTGDGMATPDDIIQAYRDLLGRDPENDGAITGRLGRTVADIRNEIANSPEGLLRATIPAGRGGGGSGGGGGGNLNFADGGEMMLSRPTALVDIASGVRVATAAMGGQEMVSFGGEARRRDAMTGGGPLTVQLIADGRKLAEVVLPYVASEIDSASAGQYGRRT